MYKSWLIVIYIYINPLVMGFRTDGSSHRDGVANEAMMVDMSNANTSRGEMMRRALGNCNHVNHIGGTKTKSDAITDLGNTISIKRHKRKSGSFDYHNTTHINIATTAKLDYIKKNAKSLSDARRMVKICANKLLKETIQQELITDILHGIYDEFPDYYMINVEHQRKIFIFPKHAIRHMFNSTTPQQPSTISTSSCTLNQFNMRIRFVLNNGVKALMWNRREELNINSSNNSSFFAMKIQQDGVDKMLKSLQHSTIIDY